jgi:dipeptidyl aminopeptidase/acylaminoacyl peptidase
MALVLQDPTPDELGKKKQGDDYKARPRPWVIDRQGFKTDYVGYLDRRRKHVYVLDVESGKHAQLTTGDYDDSQPVWSPDGQRIAFTSNRTEEPDLNFNTDIWTVSTVLPDQGFNPLTRVTSTPGEDSAPTWSPDGKFIAHVAELHAGRSYYNTNHLAVSPAGGGELRLLTEPLDRNISSPRFTSDGKSILFSLEDSGEQILARVPASGGEVERLISGQDVLSSYHMGKDGMIAARISRPHQPPEIFLYRDGELQQRTFVNTELLDTLELGEVVEVQFNSADGTEVEGFIIKPPGFEKGKKYPVILDIHGGPQSQYNWSFGFNAQLLAANGYLVVHPNPRGSTGYGEEFCLGIWQAWGQPDYEDVMAAVDHAIELGWADPDRMGVMGWSYGGMLTNHIITKTDRFKAAATGASATLYVANYGHDMYLRWWEQELGQPWKPEARALYEKLSPFNQVENVVTPTLIMGGEKDWNVPIINSEQLYLALRRLGVDTELVVYPGEFHGIGVPHHNKDLFERHLAWFEKYLD